jgi:hypothetical protein
MKFGIALPISLLMLGAMASSNAVELPSQKPGLWKITMTNGKMPGGPRSFTMCLDPASIAASRASADAHIKNDCTAKSSLRKDGDNWIADAECTFSGMHVTSHSVTTVHGDDSFHTQVNSTMNGKTDVMTMDNVRIGACKPGQKVGVPLVGK